MTSVPITRILLRAVVLAAALVGSYFITLGDVSDGNYQTSNLTELPQEIMLLVASGLLLYAARLPGVGQRLMRASGVFGLICLVREFDNDMAWIAGNDTWLVPAGLLGAYLVYFLYSNFRTVIGDAEALGDTFGFAVWSTGWVLLMVFSRLWGRNDIWRAIMAEDFDRTVSRVNEEGLELMCYAVILYGTIELVGAVHLRRRRLADTPTSSPARPKDFREA